MEYQGIMDNDLQRIEDWIGGLLVKVSPVERRRLSRKIGLDLRRSQSVRIASQLNPDVTYYAPIKNQKRLRSNKGRLKRMRKEMFPRLKMVSRMNLKTDQDQISISFLEKVSRIARVHQLGLKDRVSKNGPDAQYPARRLLGFSQTDEQLIRDSILKHLKT